MASLEDDKFVNDLLFWLDLYRLKKVRAGLPSFSDAFKRWGLTVPEASSIIHCCWWVRAVCFVLSDSAGSFTTVVSMRSLVAVSCTAIRVRSRLSRAERMVKFSREGTHFWLRRTFTILFSTDRSLDAVFLFSLFVGCTTGTTWNVKSFTSVWWLWHSAGTFSLVFCETIQARKQSKVLSYHAAAMDTENDLLVVMGGWRILNASPVCVVIIAKLLSTTPHCHWIMQSISLCHFHSLSFSLWRSHWSAWRYNSVWVTACDQTTVVDWAITMVIRLLQRFVVMRYTMMSNEGG